MKWWSGFILILNFSLVIQSALTENWLHLRSVRKIGVLISDLEEIKGWILNARDLGLSYQQSGEKWEIKEADKLLKNAEKDLRKLIKKDEYCRECYELLSETLFYKSYFQFEKNYDDCIDISKKGLEIFPENPTLYFYLGYAHYNTGEYAEACKSLNTFLIMSSGNPGSEAQVHLVLNDAHQRFLNGWNKQVDFYQSRDARIDVYDQSRNAFYTAFQITPEWELNAGQQAFNQLASEAPEYRDPEVQQYLENLVSKLVNNTPGPYSNYKITILESEQINAVTPPGHIIIYTGLLQFAENESQLAGVLAHEMAHNFGHHAGTRFIKGLRTQSIANAIYASLNNEQQWIQLATQLAGQIGVGLFQKAHSRETEKEADLYGAHIMFNAGYNPASLSEFFLKLYELNPKQPAKFLSTHPPSPDRALYLTEYLESFPMNREMKIDSEEFQRIKSRFGPIGGDGKSKSGLLPPVIKNK